MANGLLSRQYLVIWAWLLVLMTLSISTGLMPITRSVAITIMFSLAVVKAVLVAIHFMHLKVETWLIHTIALVPVVLVVGLLFALFPDFVFAR